MVVMEQMSFHIESAKKLKKKNQTAFFNLLLCDTLDALVDILNSNTFWRFLENWHTEHGKKP